MRGIPDHILAYPVLIRMDNTWGSGFYLNLGTEIYLITAKHVLFHEDNSLQSGKYNLLSHPVDINASGELRIDLKMDKLESDGNILIHSDKDVCAVKIGDNKKEKNEICAARGVKFQNTSKSGPSIAPLSQVKKLDSVLVANETIVFGYPASIGLQNKPQFNPFQPLLRKGIVASKFLQKGTIVLDNCTYAGNSGGPVLEIEWDYPSQKINFWLIGVVTDFIPVAENERYTNSGYSVAVAMDFVLELFNIES